MRIEDSVDVSKTAVYFNREYRRLPGKDCGDGGLVREAGEFRSGDVGVFDGDTVIHMGARPQFVPELIADLLAWAHETDLHPAIKSAVVHSEIETIHPFEDGNGRMGRLWQTLILAKWNPLFAWIPMESVIYERRPEYYDALQVAQKSNDSGVFIEFTLAALLETVEAQAKIQAEPPAESKDGIKDGMSDGINEVQQLILTVMSKNPRITMEALALELGINKRNTEKNVKALKDAGRIVRVGARRNGHWEVR
jgi:Fic family protein